MTQGPKSSATRVTEQDVQFLVDAACGIDHPSAGDEQWFSLHYDRATFNTVQDHP